MSRFILFLSFLSATQISGSKIGEIVEKLDRVTNFALEHYQEINFDGLLGFVIAEAQILEAHKIVNRNDLKILLEKSEILRQTIRGILPIYPEKMVTLGFYLLNPQNWITTNNYFVRNSLKNLGIYKNWTREDILENKHATYKGVETDFCLLEILREDCKIGYFCREMMLAPRVDTGYLLTHRLLYLQVMRLKKCSYDQEEFSARTRTLCSLILREASTDENLDFPQHDIFLEQTVLCGLEGYVEFLDSNWQDKILDWQTPQGCYKREDNFYEKRTTNIISYGCTDHSTGLGAAALALNLKFEIYKKYNL